MSAKRDILKEENESHIRALDKVKSLTKRVQVLINLRKREAPLSTLGRFCAMASQPDKQHDAEQIRESLYPKC